jgi:hypothetical protein
MATPPFDLDCELTRWRQSLAAHEAITPERACELESHLRDSMAALRARDLSEEEAFWIAARRLGAAAPLSAQFAEADPAAAWRNRIFWMAVGLLVVQVAQTLLMVLGGSLVWFSSAHGRPKLGYGIAWLVPLLSISAMFFFIRGLAAGRWPGLSRWLDAFCSRRSRFPWQFILLAALPTAGLFIFALYAMGHPDHFGRPASGPMALGPVLFVIWPFLMAILAAVYAPKRMPQISRNR